ncbi:hypothetical protein [Novosphingobium album (ex Liu et al. 2023)]|uniref:Uncharacterized protein n=1 Tax=Novosphingobium album (ex Liu et al. 2023) TaxID=3031130 RepID=A0ABT5WWT1_9SPHN|nr:hypothetical protein [Novosphingobium album (ex Liu et al. 2023)]MDE8654365.1 hypothetical protein [Novosphingobium album (ex Liu et al. 2023)]
MTFFHPVMLDLLRQPLHRSRFWRAAGDGDRNRFGVTQHWAARALSPLPKHLISD